MHFMRYTNTLIFATLSTDTLGFSMHHSDDCLPSYHEGYLKESYSLAILFHLLQPSAITTKPSSMEWTTLTREIGDES